MLVLLLILIIAAVLIAIGVFWLATNAILFARATLALCVALLLSQGDCTLVPDQGFLNFLAWALICFGVVYFLAIFPRADTAIHFLCTMVVSLIITELVGALIGSIFVKDFEMTALYEIAIKVVCIGMSTFGIFLRGKKLPSESSAHLLVRFFDRLLASALYSFSLLLICSPLHNHWEFPLSVQWIVLIVGAVGTYVADIFLANKLLFGDIVVDDVAIPR